jgi:hypothetical protein
MRVAVERTSAVELSKEYTATHNKQVKEIRKIIEVLNED